MNRLPLSFSLSRAFLPPSASQALLLSFAEVLPRNWRLRRDLAVRFGLSPLPWAVYRGSCALASVLRGPGEAAGAALSEGSGQRSGHIPLGTGCLCQGLGRQEAFSRLCFSRVTFDCPPELLICPSLCFWALEIGAGTESHLCVPGRRLSFTDVGGGGLGCSPQSLSLLPRILLSTTTGRGESKTARSFRC